MPKASSSASLSFRVGRVRGYRRGQIWYLQYQENGRRHRPRVGPELRAAKQLAAQTHAQLASSDVALFTFEAIAIPELRKRWLEHHEHVLRSSIHTINRYRTATDHLLNFLRDVRPVQLASNFTARDAEALTAYLRTIEVAPNGHKNSAKRALLDKGVKFILECCRALFTYAAKRRHLSPYAENPFTAIEVDRIPIEQSKPIELFTPEQEQDFLEACDDWQFPIFLTLMLTGLRPGELCHLLLPDDVDLEVQVLRVRNKPKLGWQIKTRSERDVPLVPILSRVLKEVIGPRATGPLFRQPRCERMGHVPELNHARPALETEADHRVSTRQTELNRSLSRQERLETMRGIWHDLCALKEDRIRLEFIRIARRVGLAKATAPKVLRHMFATTLQDGNVDPLVRNLLMGHTAGKGGRPGAGLGMTAVYTHTRPETVRRQLDTAISLRAAIKVAERWVAPKTGPTQAGV